MKKATGKIIAVDLDSNPALVIKAKDEAGRDVTVWYFTDRSIIKAIAQEKGIDDQEITITRE